MTPVSAQSGLPAPALNGGNSGAAAASIPVTLLELERTAFDGSHANFRTTVDAAAKAAGGELLFELPASGLVEDCQTIAVLRVPSPTDLSRKTMLALLDGAGAAIRLQEPDENTSGLVHFADAFVDVLRRIGGHASAAASGEPAEMKQPDHADDPRHAPEAAPNASAQKS